MAGLRIEGNTSGNVAEVDVNNQLKVALSTSTSNAGYSQLLSVVDDGTITGSKLTRQPEASEDYRLRIGLDTCPLMSEYFPGTALNSAIWTAPVTTMTVTVAAGFLSLNAGTSTASGAVARVSSYRSFPIYNTAPVYMEAAVQFTQLPQANNVCEWGLGIATGTSVPTDGVFFRLLADGSLRAITNTGGIEVQSADLNFASNFGANVTRHTTITINDDVAEFWVNDVLLASIPRQTAASGIVVSQNLPMFFRNYNTNVTAAAQVMKVGLAGVSVGDVATNKPWAHIRAGAGDMGYQGPTGVTMGTTALYTNSLAPGAGVAATNTTAALGSGLGGQFALQPTLTASTDGIIQSYQVPLGTAAVPGKSLFITGVRITGVVTTALTGGPVIGLWSLAFGHTTVSLATTETATSKTARRIPLGINSFPATAAVGTMYDREIYVPFTTPVVVQPGEFVQCVMKNVGTVTSAGVITYLITYDSYWE